VATVVDRQRAIPRAKAACKRAAEAVLPDQPVVVALVDDATMARLHSQFLGKSGPTDVLSFPHGEIVVSADTARREAESRDIPPLSELVLYVVHGALHLKGYDDKRPKDKAKMRAAERRVLSRLGHGDVFAARSRGKKKSRRLADRKRR
jgi:probable rRNA maturation factor